MVLVNLAYPTSSTESFTQFTRVFSSDRVTTEAPLKIAEAKGQEFSIEPEPDDNQAKIRERVKAHEAKQTKPPTTWKQLTLMNRTI